MVAEAAAAAAIVLFVCTYKPAIFWEKNASGELRIVIFVPIPDL